MGWSKIVGSELWMQAKLAYGKNGGVYHGFSHILDLYRYADNLDIPYSLSLDRAILAHDVIINLGHGASERASAAWLNAALTAPDSIAEELILSTASHSPHHRDNTLALLDLYNLTNRDERNKNTSLLLLEARHSADLKGQEFDGQKWLDGTLSYLSDVARKICADLNTYEGKYKDKWDSISHGAAVSVAVIPSTFGNPDSRYGDLTAYQVGVLRYLDLRGPRSIYSTGEILEELYAPGVDGVWIMHREIHDLAQKGLIHYPEVKLPAPTYTLNVAKQGLVLDRVSIEITEAGLRKIADMKVSFREVNHLVQELPEGIFMN